MSESDQTPPGTVPVDRPNPLKTLTLLLAPGMAAVSAILTYLVSQGLVSQAVSDAVNAATGAAVDSVGVSAAGATVTPMWAPIAAALLAGLSAALTSVMHSSLARRKVTPKDDPRDDDGVRLVRADAPLARQSSATLNRARGGYASSTNYSRGWDQSDRTAEQRAPRYGGGWDKDDGSDQRGRHEGRESGK